jgi:hypothetical protein
MSKERKVDDAELGKVSGAGEFVTPDGSTGDDSNQPGTKPVGGGGGSGPNEPDPVGGGGGGNQTPSWDD